MEMTDQVRTYVRSLNALALATEDIQSLLQIMLELDPECGPIPTTTHGRKLAAMTYVRLMQGSPIEGFTFFPKTWREAHAR